MHMFVRAAQQQRKIRLLIVTHTLDKGGLEEVILMYAKFLSKQKYAITVACRIAGLAASEIASLDGVKMLCYESPGKWKRFLSLWRIARDFKPDIVHNHFDWYGLIVGWLVGAKRVETVHNTYYWFVGFQRYAFAFYLRFASRVIVVSDYVRKFTVEFFPFVDEKNIVVVHNGVDVQRFQPAQQDVRKELRIAPHDVVVGFIGRLEEQKGIAYLLQAINELNKAFNNLKVVIVGDGTLREQLQSQARTLQLTNVEFVGFQSDTPKYFRLFDVFVLPSLFEGLPVSVIQAMAAGCPVVASKVGGVAEVVEHEVTGILVEAARPQHLAAALCRLIEKPELRKSMGERARERARRDFSAEAMLTKTEKIYSELLGA